MRPNTWKKAPGGASGGIGNATFTSFLNAGLPGEVIFKPPPKFPPGTLGRSGNRSGPKASTLNVTPLSSAPSGMIIATPPDPVIVPPPAPTATEPSAATNWLRVKLVVAPIGSVIVSCRTSLMVPGKLPETDPSFSAVRDNTNPLV
ncbi:MAG TPA: hypothetical protein VI636_09485 [Candidatus Angelobacter sp.]